MKKFVLKRKPAFWIVIFVMYIWSYKGDNGIFSFVTRHLFEWDNKSRICTTMWKSTRKKKTLKMSISVFLHWIHRWRNDNYKMIGFIGIHWQSERIKTMLNKIPLTYAKVIWNEDKLKFSSNWRWFKIESGHIRRDPVFFRSFLFYPPFEHEKKPKIRCTKKTNNENRIDWLNWFGCLLSSVSRWNKRAHRKSKDKLFLTTATCKTWPPKTNSKFTLIVSQLYFVCVSQRKRRFHLNEKAKKKEKFRYFTCLTKANFVCK